MRDIIEKKAKVVASFLEEHNCKDVVIVPLEEGAFTASVRACDSHKVATVDYGIHVAKRLVFPIVDAQIRDFNNTILRVHR